VGVGMLDFVIAVFV